MFSGAKIVTRIRRRKCDPKIIDKTIVLMHASSTAVLRSSAYKAVIRLQLEYAASVWDPHTVTHINQIERAQRKAARWVKSDFRRTSSVTTMLNTLGWRNLAQRRADSRLVLMNKIVHVHGLVAIHLTQLTRPSRISRSSHPFFFRQIQIAKNIYKYSFFPLTMVQWNKLPSSADSLPSVDQLKGEVSNRTHLRS